jgi:hypothetical protein
MVKSKLTERKRNLLLAGEMAALGAACVILLVFAASTLDGLLIRGGQSAAVVTSILVELANTDRTSNKVGELTVNPQLVAIAQAKANDMATNGYFAHTSPAGLDPWHWFAKGGYLFSYAGENLAVDFSDSVGVEQAWMNSPAHRANILNTHFTEIGIATAVGTYQGRKTTFVVQEFGTPAHMKSTTSEPPTDLNKPSAPGDIALATTEPAPKVLAAQGPSVARASSTDTTPSTEATSSSQTILGSSVTGLSAPPPTVTERLKLADLWNVFAASPRTTLETAYYLFGLLILIALVIETGIEIRRHHMRHVGIVLGLMVLMVGLFAVADRLVFTDPVIATTAAFTSN